MCHRKQYSDKVNSIYIWRVIFTYMIAIYHFFNSYGFNPRFPLIQQFFFIVSGLLLANEAENRKHASAIRYTVSRLKKLYPHYIFSFCISLPVYICFFILKNYSFLQILKILGSYLWEVLMLDMIGLNLSQMVNVPTWYLSVLLLGGYLLYWFLVNKKKVLLEILIPVYGVIYVSYMFRQYHGLPIVALDENATTGLWLNLPFCFGLFGMSIGVMLFYLGRVCRLKDRMERCNNRLFNMCECILMAGAIIICIFTGGKETDFLVVAMLAAGVLISFNRQSVRKNGYIMYLYKLCYPIYLNHNIFRNIFSVAVPFSGGYFYISDSNYNMVNDYVKDC